MAGCLLQMKRYTSKIGHAGNFLSQILMKMLKHLTCFITALSLPRTSVYFWLVFFFPVLTGNTPNGIIALKILRSQSYLKMNNSLGWIPVGNQTAVATMPAFLQMCLLKYKMVAPLVYWYITAWFLHTSQFRKVHLLGIGFQRGILSRGLQQFISPVK